MIRGEAASGVDWPAGAFDVGADRIEVGRFLTAADRRRLMRVLEGFVERGVEGASVLRIRAVCGFAIVNCDIAQAYGIL